MTPEEEYTPAPTATEGATEVPTPEPTTVAPEDEYTPAPTATEGATEVPTPEPTTSAPVFAHDELSDEYSSSVMEQDDGSTVVTLNPGSWHVSATPAPTVDGSEMDEVASPKLQYVPTSAPTTKTYGGEEQVTPTTGVYDVLAPEAEIPLETVTPAPTAPFTEYEKTYPLQNNDREDYRQKDASDRNVHQPDSVNHPMCA
ncbi:unnamed protein product [Phytophthora fragariaefolia]|uniref:Unnamed protein product n=1 Tax=Phytophthora fragariaefolia TaxID=1490495 RepID=A0A9W7D1Q9_9STRA|nr:unnamed protein product [Phytophthora fragariaefolia]